MASSSASLVPDPTEKCAVCAASPINTIGTSRPSMDCQWTHRRHTTRGNRIQIAEPRRTVARHDDVSAEVARGGLIVDDVVLEHELDAEILAAPLQDVQQADAADAAEAVAARSNGTAAEMDVDVVPVIEGTDDLSCGFRVRALQIAERLIGEHDTPAERVLRAVALEHAHFVPGIGELCEQRRVKTCGTAANAKKPHSAWSSLMPGDAVTLGVNILRLN